MAPWDGCVDSVGNLFVVAMLPWERTQARVHCVFVRRPAATVWESSEPLTDEQIDAIEDWKPLRRDWPRICVEPGGRIAVFADDRRRSPAIVVAERGQLLPAEGRVVLSPGLGSTDGLIVATVEGSSQVVTRLGAAGGGAASRIAWRLPGAFLGMDRHGGTYVGDISSGGGLVFSCHRFDGELIAIGRAKIHEGIVSTAPLATPDGTVYDFDFLESGMAITRWRFGR